MTIKTNVVVPVFNEEQYIIKVIKNIEKSLKNDYVITICYDYDDDLTLKVLADSANKINLKKIRYCKNKFTGPHSAVMQGLKSIRASYHVVIPADDLINSLTINHLVNLADQGYSIVCPSRFVHGGSFTGAPFIKAMINKFVNKSLKFLGMPTSDSTNGFRLFSQHVIDNILIKSNSGFIYSMEYLMKSYELDFKICEYPSIWSERNMGNSKFKLGLWCYQYFYFYLKAIKICILKRFINYEK